MDPWTEPPAIARPRGVETFATAMITGHRPKVLTPAEQAWSQVAITSAAWRLRSVYGTTTAISGLALGADTWWALAALANGMHLHAYVPFEAQASKWHAADQALWRELRTKAKHEVVVGGEHYDVRMLHARNDAMLTATAAAQGLVVALYKPGTSGGTHGAVESARKQSLPLLLLDPATRTVTREGW